MKQAQTIIAWVRAGVCDDNLSHLQRTESFQRPEKSSLNKLDSQAVRRGRHLLEEGQGLILRWSVDST